MNKNCNAGVYLYNCDYGRTVNDYLGPKSMKYVKIYRDYERISVQYVIFLELFELIWNFFGKLKCFDLQNDLHSALSVSTHFMTIFDEKT